MLSFSFLPLIFSLLPIVLFYIYLHFFNSNLIVLFNYWQKYLYLKVFNNLFILIIIIMVMIILLFIHHLIIHSLEFSFYILILVQQHMVNLLLLFIIHYLCSLKNLNSFHYFFNLHFQVIFSLYMYHHK